ncbi:bifunctional 3-(3-hydroxy-phenyl)propionate/3-hydroxycinnamic acid hydroxylase [Kribbella capetownensis]|uniref:Bifunctional 3-(3-hydroxy-phenyl)propionate/3-hydroxycinnamic acid hydroxylase n=1 Tax=Kribbella capetownensis TaxID=1572659 RepID=A0A4R0KD80_9ACTN|nr:bifunctional 3-(3-hydroxy-phenyl)propionate/3-hydroxycinnamic acid hydroxylase [Kribbella capetownensis]TCC53365.1 bifunctional 3-(3-hydroxy-phenyl)propionate/3-hydroxycinnamic acid hydroxylase [Kribbella capetownensis]
MTESAADYDVAVVGAGPTGLALANLLAAQDVRVVLIDPNKIVCQHPRASHLDDETMRTFQQFGLSEAQQGYLVMDGYQIMNQDGKLLFSWEISDGETDQAWLSDYMFFQPDFEAALRGRLATSKNVDLLLGWDLVDLADDGTAVTLDVRQRRSDAEKSVTAAFVVGCDGANSFVRQRLAPDLVDFDGDERSLIIDVVKFKPAAGLSETIGTIVSGTRPFTHMPIVAPMSRFEFMLLADEDRETYEDPAMVYSLLEPWMEPGSYRITRSDVYLWHACVAAKWRVGRVLLAGDAAHQMPPMLGQGMCSGIRDAANLAWKLALVLRGTAGDGLLDSYEPERAPHVREMVVESTRLAKNIAALGQGQAPPKEADGEVADKAHPPIEPAIGGDADLPMAGQLAPQPRLRDGRRLDDAVGFVFTLLAPGEVLGGVDESTRQRWKRMGVVPVRVEDLEPSDWLDTHQVTGILVRPDRYVFAGFRSAEELETVTRHLSVSVFEEEIQQ